MCDEACWETWTETEDGREIHYTARTCGHDEQRAEATP